MLYNREELIDLVTVAPPYNLINELSLYLSTRNDETYSDIDLKKALYKDYPKVSKLIYEVPLDLIPLFINHESNLIRAISLWRLRIAK
jgi:hypothetical protein